MSSSTFIERGRNRDREDRVSRFKYLAEQYAAEVVAANGRCRPYEGVEPALFAQADDIVQKRAIAFLETAVAVFSEMRQHREKLRDNRILLWRLLARHGYAPDAEIFERMTDEDAVEIYTFPDHLHLGWNLRFMEVLSFTLEQLVCLPWWQLFRRDERIDLQLAGISDRLVRNEITSTVPMGVPLHQLNEINSEELLIFELNLTLISPIRQDNRNVGFIVLSRNRCLGSLAERDIG